MRIKRITIQGMHKISQQSYEFNDGVTYLVGPNGVGKSTVLEAIQLGLLGYIPGYAKTNESIMKHASGPVMAVILELDSGIKITRTWTRSGSSVSSKVSTEGYDGKPADVATDLVGQVELPIFNFTEFKSMTANKLKEWFISFLPNSEGDLDTMKELEDEANKRSVPHDDLIENVKNWIKDRPEKGIELVKALNAHFKEDQSFVKGQISKLQGTLESLIRYDEADELDEEEVRAALTYKESLEAKLIAYEAQEAMHNQSKQRLEALRNSLSADSFAEDPTVVQLQAESTKLVRRIDSLKKKLADQPNILADAKIVEIDKQIRIMEADYASIQNAIIELRDKRAALSSAEPICPYTKERCDTATKLAESFKADAAEIDRQIAFKREEAKDCSPEQVKKLMVQMEARENELRSASADIQNQIRSAEIKINEINQQLARINSNYVAFESAKAQLVELGERPTGYTREELTGEIAKLRDQLSKIAANKQYAALTETVTQDKFRLECELEILKDWIKLTDANGLQSKLMDKPFEDLAGDMSKYLTAMFGTEVEAKFNLVSKANSFSFGLQRGNQYIEFDYLSSGERCLFTLALTMCILDKSAADVRVLIIDDILDHLDSTNADYLFEALKKVKDLQFILAGVKECSDATICKQI